MQPGVYVVDVSLLCVADAMVRRACIFGGGDVRWQCGGREAPSFSSDASVARVRWQDMFNHALPPSTPLPLRCVPPVLCFLCALPCGVRTGGVGITNAGEWGWLCDRRKRRRVFSAPVMHFIYFSSFLLSFCLSPCAPFVCAV